jgi:transmembrane sensor
MSFMHMKTNKHMEDKDWELIAKSIYDKNPDSTNDEFTSGVDDLFSTEKEKIQILEMAKQIDHYFDLKKYPAETALEKVNSRIHKKTSAKQGKIKSLIFNPLFRIAASFLLVALLIVSGFEVIYRESSKFTKISATNRIRETFILPDGTQVSLNTNTKMQFPKVFAQNIREVTIEGEAFFKVTPNKTKPFIIHAGNAEIKVLGTSFNVNAYPAAKSVEVIVETGKVQVLNKGTENIKTHELILTPGDKGTLVNSSNSLLKSTNQNPNFLSWKTRNLIFKATSLSEVIENLEKVYNVTIHLNDPKLNELLLTAQFNDYPLDFILKVIETTFKIEVHQVNGQYILKARS